MFVVRSCLGLARCEFGAAVVDHTDLLTVWTQRVATAVFAFVVSDEGNFILTRRHGINTNTHLEKTC